jgi:hypothetical protein
VGTVDSVVKVVDFVVQGLMFLFVVWYALHGIKRFAGFDDRFRESFGRFLPRDRRTEPEGASPISGEASPTPKMPDEARRGSWLTDTVLLTLVIGGLYALGLITNEFSFLALEPAHESVILTVEQTKRQHVFSWSLLLSPAQSLSFLGRLHPPDPGTVLTKDEAAHARSVCERVAWSNLSHAVEEDELEPLLKPLRVLRGAMISLLALMFASVLKLFARIVFSPAIWTRPLRWWSPPLYLAFAFLLYLACMSAWASVEANYHLTVLYGIRTASPSSTASSQSKSSVSEETTPPSSTTRSASAKESASTAEQVSTTSLQSWKAVCEEGK